MAHSCRKHRFATAEEKKERGGKERKQENGGENRRKGKKGRRAEHVLRNIQGGVSRIKSA